MGRGTNPWVSWIDGRRYLWIEEYPQQLDQTFNGFVFAIIGLHDYSQLTKDPALYSATRDSDVLALLRGGHHDDPCLHPDVQEPGRGQRLLPRAPLPEPEVPPRPHRAAPLPDADHRRPLVRPDGGCVRS